MNVVMIGPFGLTVKSTMRERALPMAKALVKRGHRVTLIIPPWDSPAAAGQSWVEEGVQIINTTLPDRKGPLFHLQLTGQLVQTALRYQPEVIHLFKPKAYAGLAHVWLYLLRQLRRHQARLVVDEDDWEAAWNEIGAYSALEKRFFAWQEPWGLTHADSLTVASRALQRLAEVCAIPPRQIHYVPNGTRPLNSPLNIMKGFPVWQEELATIVDSGEPIWGLERERVTVPQFGPAFFSSDFSGKVRTEYDLFGLPIILLYTRFVEFQLDFLLNLISRVSDYLPEARWLVVGKGYFEEEQQLQELARTRGLGGRLIFTGWVPQTDLPHYFAAANVAIYPYDDTLLNRTKCSIKLLDLLSAGVPVVASRVGQNVEYISHGKTGLLVPPQDVEKMAEALLLILNNQGIQRSLGQEAARRVNRAFSWDVLVESVEAAYRPAR